LLYLRLHPRGTPLFRGYPKALAKLAGPPCVSEVEGSLGENADAKPCPSKSYRNSNTRYQETSQSNLARPSPHWQSASNNPRFDYFAQPRPIVGREIRGLLHDAIAISAIASQPQGCGPKAIRVVVTGTLPKKPRQVLSESDKEFP
jgi:hypothetical protein